MILCPNRPPESERVCSGICTGRGRDRQDSFRAFRQDSPRRQSITINREDKSTSINTQMESLIPASKISTLTQGMFVGAVADNYDERIEQKIFHCEIVVDAEKVKREEQAYRPIPVITDFTDADGNDRMKEMIQDNYNRIRAEVRQIVADELQRVQSDPELQYLLSGR